MLIVILINLFEEENENEEEDENDFLNETYCHCH